MYSASSETFGSFFKKLRLQANILSLAELGRILAQKGYFYEDSIFSHWQNDTKIPKKRLIFILLLQIFSERTPITIDDANTFLQLAEMGLLTPSEMEHINVTDITNHAPFFAPPQVSYFAGREKELEALKKLISVYRIIQIWGQAGLGKTALAIAFAHQVAPLFPDGVLWYRLDTSDISSIFNHIAKLYNEYVDDIKDISLKLSIIRSVIKDKEVLVILDNVEDSNNGLHFLTSLGEHVRYLITTRHSYLPLDHNPYLVKLHPFSDKEAEELYKKITHTGVSKRFLYMCQQYENLPLAVANFAKRIGYLETNKISYDVDTLVANPANFFVYEDRNLYRLLTDTKQLLSPTEAQVWQSTALFNGLDFSQEVLQHMHGLSLPETKNILEKLFHLSLVEQSVHARWRIHPLIKSFLTPFLEKDNYTKAIDFYAKKFIRNENGYIKVYPQIDEEFDNIRSLLAYSLTQGDLENASKLWEFFSIYLWDRGNWYMFKDIGEQIFQLGETVHNTLVAATVAIRDLSWLYIWQGELLRAYKLLTNQDFRQAIERNDFLVGLLYERLGFIFCQHKRESRALQYLYRAQEKFLTLHDYLNLAKIYLYIGNTYESVRKFDKALDWYQKAFDLADKYHYVETKSISQYYTGEVYRKTNQVLLAEKYFISAVEIDESMKRRSGIGWNKHSLSEIAKQQGKILVAHKLHREAHEAFSLVGVYPHICTQFQELP